MSKCRVCRKPFRKLGIDHKDCSADCALEGLKIDKEKKAQKQLKADKLKAKPRREWLKETQAIFNQFIRLRDAHLPCISCGRHHSGQYHAGHYLSVGARPELRFCEENNNKQCSACNNYLSGNIALYRINLIKKIGIERVEWLEGNHEPKQYTIEDLQELQRVYKARIKEFKSKRPE